MDNNPPNVEINKAPALSNVLEPTQQTKPPAFSSILDNNPSNVEINKAPAFSNVLEPTQQTKPPVLESAQPNQSITTQTPVVSNNEEFEFSSGTDDFEGFEGFSSAEQHQPSLAQPNQPTNFNAQFNQIPQQQTPQIVPPNQPTNLNQIPNVGSPQFNENPPNQPNNFNPQFNQIQQQPQATPQVAQPPVEDHSKKALQFLNGLPDLFFHVLCNFNSSYSSNKFKTNYEFSSKIELQTQWEFFL